MIYPRFGLATTTNFAKVWDDEGSHAKLNFGIWRPQPAPVGFVGDYPVEGHYEPGIANRTVYIHSIVDDDPTNPALKPPERLEPIWHYPNPRWNSEAKVICRPIAPHGYVACGFAGTIARPNEDLAKLHIPGLMCVRSDLTDSLHNPTTPPYEPMRFHSFFIWNDHGSELFEDCSVYRMHSLGTGIDTMWAAPKYMSPKERVWSYETIRGASCFPVRE